MSYPDITTAISLWQESLSGNCKWNKEKAKEYIFHTSGVAESAEKIALSCGIEGNKAYVLGLLHDYGKIQNEKKSRTAHFIFGYQEMKRKGFDDVARICITHSFPDHSFAFNEYSSYSIKDLQEAKSIISKLEYDDYDRLIQLCDMFFEGMNKISFQERIAGIRQRYNLSVLQTANLEKYTAANKKYFDEKCGCDIYKILGI